MQIDSERVEFDNNSSQWIFLFFVQTFPGYSLISSYVIQFISVTSAGFNGNRTWFEYIYLLAEWSIFCEFGGASFEH